jgi:hypothetical protein
MSTRETDPQALSSIALDYQAVFEAAAQGRQVDPEIGERVRRATERITQEIYQKHGLLDVAVEAVREGREER